MSAFLHKINLIWLQRKPQEKALLLVLLFIVCIALLYQFVYIPIAHDKDRLQQALPGLRAEATRFSRDLNLVTGGLENTSATVEITTLATAAGLPRNTFKITHPDKTLVQIQAQGAAWSAIVQLLADAHAQGLELNRLRTHSTSRKSIVDVDIEWKK